MIIVDPVVFRLPLDCKRAEVWLRHTGDYIVYDYEALHCDDSCLRRLLVVARMWVFTF